MRVFFKFEFNKITNYIGCRRYKREQFYEDCIWYFIDKRVLPQINKLNITVDSARISSDNINSLELFYMLVHFLYPYHYNDKSSADRELKEKAKSIYKMLY
jgi:hypothetical protein